jgi:hypothetical protein
MTQQSEGQPNEQPNIDISFKLPNNVYKAALGMSLLLGYDRFEDYLYELIQGDLRTNLKDGALTMIIEDEKRVKKIHEELWPSYDDCYLKPIVKTNQFLCHLDR